MIWNRETIKSLAKREGCSPRDLFVLEWSNDPFYIGGEAEIRNAQWALDLFKKMNIPRTHTRRMHYYALSVGTVRPNGEPYLNTERDYKFLINAIKFMRYLRYVPMDCVEDKRNPPPQINACYWQHSTIDNVLHQARTEEIAKFIAGKFFMFNQQLQQPYHLEIWQEKDTLNDVLEPVTQEYNINNVTCVGEASLTQVSEMMARIVEAKKPTRIFYVSDFDPRGSDMPVAVGRKVEWFVRKRNANLDIKLKKLILTKDQCIEYRLPRVPVKKPKGGKGAKSYETLTRKFEEIHGEGATELDALEALHPGEAARILREAIEPYFDAKVKEHIDKLNDAIVASIYKAVLDHESEFQEIMNSLELNDTRRIAEKQLPKGRLTRTDENDFLLDTKLSYIQQLKRFKAYKTGDNDWYLSQ